MPFAHTTLSTRRPLAGLCANVLAHSGVAIQAMAWIEPSKYSHGLGLTLPATLPGDVRA